VAKPIYLLRHGETAWSLSGQHTGRTDLPLTEKGERQALQLRERLHGIPFTHVLTSPRQRAQRTCALAGFGAVARVDPDLQEWDYGAYEGLTTAEIRTQQRDWIVFQNGCPQGESPQQISQRADRVLSHLRSLDGIVALFSHGHFLRAIAVRWIGRPVLDGRHFALDTGSMSMLDYDHADQAQPVISRWNTVTDAL
jgi:broad specificity phosphatase PhoE